MMVDTSPFTGGLRPGMLVTRKKAGSRLTLFGSLAFGARRDVADLAVRRVVAVGHPVVEGAELISARCSARAPRLKKSR